jgi:3-dehydrosphinganine reductase
MRDFAGKSVLITGGSSGIGLALAQSFASRQAHICILARDQVKLESAVREIQAKSISTTQIIRGLQSDVSNRAEVQTTLLHWMESSGVPDLVINSAGIARPGEFEGVTLDDFDQMMAVNFMGTVNVTHAILPAMLQRKSGHIVNISSLVGFLGMYGYTAYASSKFAIRGFTDSLRAEVKTQGIDLSIVFPTDTDTPQLAEENKYKPPILFAIDEAAPPMSAGAGADSIIRGIQKRRYVITPGISSWLFFHLSNLLGVLTYPVVDWIVADAREKVKRNQARYTHQNKIDPN